MIHISDEAVRDALRSAAQAMTTAGAFLANPAIGDGPRQEAFDQCVAAASTCVALVAAAIRARSEDRG